MICVSGTPVVCGARIDDCVIEGCTFKTLLVCCIVVAQSNSIGVTLGKRWTIRDNLFLNSALTPTTTSIFAWADDVRVGQYLLAGLAIRHGRKTGGVTAYEVHAPITAIGNRVRTTSVASGLARNPATTVEEQHHRDNFETMFCRLTRALVLTDRQPDTLIREHVLFDSVYLPGRTPTQKAAVNIACNYAVSDLS